VSTASAALRADAAEVCGVRLSGADCLGGVGHDCGLEFKLGGPGFGFGSVATNSTGGMGGNEGQAVLPCSLSGVLPLVE
jgi:hypothetical protein